MNTNLDKTKCQNESDQVDKEGMKIEKMQKGCKFLLLISSFKRKLGAILGLVK